MSNKRLVKRSVMVAAMIGVMVLSFVLVTGTSEAQGPGNGGKGPGANGQGQGMNNQPATGCDTGDCDQIGTPGMMSQQNGYGMYGQNSDQGRGLYGLGMDLPPAVSGDLPDDVVDAITAGLLDEYNAYNIYQAVIDQFGAVRPFTSIQRAEAQHSASLEFIFERYGIPLPEAVELDPVPQFDSLADACAAGAAAEIANFSLYDEWLDTVQDYPDITQVFTSLRDASEYMHLPAFERCAG
jgi:hypothetical protein